MTKLKAVLATTLMALTMAIGIGGTPAYAESCANYPPGQSYRVTARPLTGQIPPGGSIRLYAQALHGTSACGGAKLSLSVRYNNSTTWRCCITRYTNSLGYTSVYFGTSTTFHGYFRYYWRFTYPGGSVISAYGLIYVK